MANTTINILDIPQSGTLDTEFDYLAVDRNNSKAVVSSVLDLKAFVTSDVNSLSGTIYDTVNNTTSIVNSAYTMANTANSIAINAYNQANMAFEQANLSAGSISVRALATAQIAYDQANISFIKANTVNNLANIAYMQANLAYAAANTNSGADAYDQANAAFQKANTANTNAANATYLSFGVVNPSLLGGGSPSSSTYLRGDKNWVTLNYQTANATLTSWSTKAVPTGDVVGTTDTQTLTNKMLYKCVEKKVTPSISSGVLTIDLTLGNVFVVSLNQNITTITLGWYSPTDATSSFILALTADGTQRTVDWGSIKWADGSAPTLTSTTGKVDIFTFVNWGGSTWYGFVSGQNM